MSEKTYTTPMMRQHSELKAKHPGFLLLTRVGHFYEAYGTDAVLVGMHLGRVVTGKPFGADGCVAMAGVPYHSLEDAISTLVGFGLNVAVAEPTEDPKQAHGLVERRVTRLERSAAAAKGDG